MAEKPETRSKNVFCLARQAWFGLALWMSLGLLLEGLIAFRSPTYLQDPIRREMFRLAHAHGTLFSILLIITQLWLSHAKQSVPATATLLLRVGTLLMPVGFLLGGIWHSATDPGIGVFLAPIGGVLVIFAVVAIGLSAKD